MGPNIAGVTPTGDLLPPVLSLQVNVRTARDNVEHGTKSVPEFLADIRKEVEAYK